MIKNKLAEGSRLPHIQKEIIANSNWFYQYNNFSAFIDISGNVFQNMLVTNFYLELEEPDLSWEELQQRGVQ